MRPLAATVTAALTAGARSLVDLALPPACAGCGTPDGLEGKLCGQCNLALLSLVSMSYCPRCGATLGPHVPAKDDGCSACPTPLPRFRRVVRLGPYAPPLRTAARDLKYRRRETMRRRLGRMLAESVAARCSDRPLEVVMPVPMHWRRRLGRGCDHARLLARTVSRRLGLPVGRELIRVRNTPPQGHLPRTRRIENVRGAFSITAARGIAGAHVLLVDDVTTTGATANEAARAMLNAGAGAVTLAVLAKAEPPLAYAQAVP